MKNKNLQYKPKFYEKYIDDNYCANCGSQEVFEIPCGIGGIVKCANCGHYGRVSKKPKKS
jgi:ribosomal protein L32